MSTDKHGRWWLAPDRFDREVDRLAAEHWLSERGLQATPVRVRALLAGIDDASWFACRAMDDGGPRDSDLALALDSFLMEHGYSQRLTKVWAVPAASYYSGSDSSSDSS